MLQLPARLTAQYAQARGRAQTGQGTRGLVSQSSSLATFRVVGLFRRHPILIERLLERAGVVAFRERGQEAGSLQSAVHANRFAKLVSVDLHRSAGPRSHIE